MEVGKIPTKLLEKIIIQPICKNNPNRAEILVKPNVGEDCTALDFGDEICVLSTDPITGANEEIGKIAVNINANDIASSGAEPIGILVTVLLPPTCDENDLEKIMTGIYENANEKGISVLGGHTEVTEAVNKPIVSCTVVGKTKNRKFISSGGARVGDDVIMTKWAGLEGTAIIANDFEKKLKGAVSQELINKAKLLSNYLSVIEEGKIAAQNGVLCMHDVTEGGILGACYEIAFCSGVGIEVELDKIPVLEETKEICKVYNINPYKLISSGCMLMSHKDGKALVKSLEENNIKATVIGKIVEDGKYIISKGEKTILSEPEADELYKAN